MVIYPYVAIWYWLVGFTRRENCFASFFGRFSVSSILSKSLDLLAMEDQDHPHDKSFDFFRLSQSRERARVPSPFLFSLLRYCRSLLPTAHRRSLFAYCSSPVVLRRLLVAELGQDGIGGDGVRDEEDDQGGRQGHRGRGGHPEEDVPKTHPLHGWITWTGASRLRTTSPAAARSHGDPGPSSRASRRTGPPAIRPRSAGSR